MAKKKTEESILTGQIRDYLNIRNVFHWKVWQGLGSAKGVSDILGIYKGYPLAIEIKRLKGRVSENQQAFLDKFKAEGGIAFIARSLDDVIRHFEMVDNNEI